MNEEISTNEDINIDYKESEEIDLLTEELPHIFNPENYNESTIPQKENLLQRVLQLSGENYTFDNLRRYLMRIE